jgi:tetratricopeptide (TPR) repeat protein
MNLKRLTILTLAALLFCAPLAAQDWVGRNRISGTVTDQDDNPIEGAEVSLYKREPGHGPKVIITKPNGRWGFLGIVGGIWTVSVVAEGMMPSEGQVQVLQNGMKPIQVRLRPIPEELLYNERALAAKKLLEEGNDLLAAKDFAGARAKYEQGMVDLDVEYHGDILLAIANSYYDEEDPESAMVKLQQAVQIDPSNPNVLLALARAHYNEGNVDQAISGLQKLLEVQPDNEVALRVVSDMLVAQGRVEEAEQYVSRLPEGTQLDPNALLNVGIEHYNNGEMDEAFTRFNQVVTEYPDMATALYYRGLVFLGRGSNEEAAADLKRFLELDPDSERATEAREFLSYLEPQG